MEDNQLKIIADYLEKMQMYEEASQIDGIIKEAGIGKSIMNTFGPPLTGPRGERGGFMTPDDARAWKQRLNSWTTFFNANLKIATEMANNDKKSPVPKQLVNLFSQMKNKFDQSLPEKMKIIDPLIRQQSGKQTMMEKLIPRTTQRTW